MLAGPKELPFQRGTSVELTFLSLGGASPRQQQLAAVQLGTQASPWTQVLVENNNGLRTTATPAETPNRSYNSRLQCTWSLRPAHGHAIRPHNDKVRTTETPEQLHSNRSAAATQAQSKRNSAAMQTQCSRMTTTVATAVQLQRNLRTAGTQPQSQGNRSATTVQSQLQKQGSRTGQPQFSCRATAEQPRCSRNATAVHQVEAGEPLQGAHDVVGSHRVEPRP